MIGIVISDASSLILLQKIILLDYLVSRFQIVISPEVYQEAVEKGKEKNFPDAYKLEEKVKNKQVKVKDIKNKGQIKEIVNTFQIGRGETESIVLSLEHGKSLVVTDDHKAINVCRVYEIPFVTALTFVLIAYEDRIIPQEKAGSMIKELGIHGRYKDKLIYEALNKLEGKK